jgi:16S rRNA (guanine527-N7)-methyltransferase
MKLQITTQAQGRLMTYTAMLEKWNQTFSLTAIHGPQQMVMRHLLDSLSLVPYIKGPRLVDVGSGAGLPGIPLALAFPEYEVVLLDSQTKKVRFIRQVVADLGMTNAIIAHTRVQDYHPQQMFDTVISRAFATLAEFAGATRHLCRTGGCMLAMKGKFPGQELEEIRHTGRTVNIIPVHIPGLEAQRHIVRISC